MTPNSSHEIALGELGSCSYCAAQTTWFCGTCHLFVCNKPECRAQHDREGRRMPTLWKQPVPASKEIDFDRRRPLRTSVKGIKVDYPDLQPLVRDLSLFGAYIEDSRPATAGTALSLCLWLSERDHISARAIVRRVDPHGMAVEFTEISSADRARLEAFLHTLNKH